MSHNGPNIDKITFLSWMTGVREMCLTLPDYPENIDWIKSCFCGTNNLVNKAISSALGPAIHLTSSAPQSVLLSFLPFIRDDSAEVTHSESTFQAMPWLLWTGNWLKNTIKSHDPAEMIPICCSRNISAYYQCWKQQWLYINYYSYMNSFALLWSNWTKTWWE